MSTSDDYDSDHKSEGSDAEISDSGCSTVSLVGKQSRPSRSKALPAKYKNGLSDPFLENGCDANSKSISLYTIGLHKKSRKPFHTI